MNMREHESLMSRRKSAHITKSQANFLLKILNKHPEPEKLACRMYKVSTSTSQILKKSKQQNAWNFKSKESFWISEGGLSSNMKLFVEKLLTPPKPTMNLRKIGWLVYEHFRQKVKTHFLRKFIEEELRYPIQKWSSRPSKYAQTETNLTQRLFCSEVLRMLLDKEVIINADEWSFDRDLKQEYTWLSKGKSCLIINILYKGKANLILDTTSNGEWFAMIHANTGDSIKFWISLKLSRYVGSKHLKIANPFLALLSIMHLFTYQNWLKLLTRIW